MPTTRYAVEVACRRRTASLIVLRTYPKRLFSPLASEGEGGRNSESFITFQSLSYGSFSARERSPMRDSCYGYSTLR